jgi:hypothetical protein
MMPQQQEHAKITKGTNVPWKLEKYAPAFAMLGANYVSQVPDGVRQILIFTALNVDWRKNTVWPFISKMFTGRDANDLKNCLERIVIIHEENAKAKKPKTEDRAR